MPAHLFAEYSLKALQVFKTLQAFATFYFILFYMSLCGWLMLKVALINY